MAVAKGAGYANLPSGNWLPVIYSQKVQKFFRTASVVEDITNTDYAGEIENFGDTVNIIKEPTISVNSYVRGGHIAIQNLAWGIGTPLFSAFAEKYGDRKAISLGLILYATGIFISSTATTPEAHQGHHSGAGCHYLWEPGNT